MSAPYDVSLSRTDSESIGFAVQLSDTDGPVSLDDLAFSYSLRGCGTNVHLTLGNGITIDTDDEAKPILTIALPVAQRLHPGTYDHGLIATDTTNLTQQIFYGTIFVSCGGFTR